MIELRSSVDPALRGEALVAARRAAAGDAVRTVALLVLIVVLGSGMLRRLDLALLGYLFATVASFAAIAYRTSLFWRRPPSAFYAKALAAALFDVRRWPALAVAVWRRFLVQSFVRRRGEGRWAGHMLLAWGTIVGFAVTMPLVFGWLHFEAVGARSYRALLFGIPGFTFSVDGSPGWLIFHALILAAFAVVAGAASLFWRRVRADGAGALAGFHVLPLALLLAVALSGLALPLAAAWAPNAVIHWFAKLHELTVIALLLALPFSKLFHIFMRPLHLGVAVVRDSSAVARCRRCSTELTAPTVQVTAVGNALAQNGMIFGDRLQLCAPCRRREMAQVHDHNLEGMFC